ncbi:carboxypeptidase-like regulatory domain-containing protein [Kordia sp.]|uniref:carboxypeptidase-like regulatory domain-containing protein n=1 Tax=Kordia sp. TaxID=1965332 RepID=UPI003D6B6327
MKHPKLIIQIPEPCHEDWNNMSPTEKGKFCGVCTKEVIDFTAKSDEELIKHVANDGNLCGRFHPSQLNRKLIADRKKRNHWLSYAATLLLPMTVFAQGKPRMNEKVDKTEQLDNYNFTRLHIGSLNRKAKVHSKKQQDSIKISGTITDNTGLPLPGATILIKGNYHGKTTDFDGNFSVKVKPNDILMISYVGYKSQEISITKTQSVYKIELKESEQLEEVTVVAGGISANYEELQGIAGGITTVNGYDMKSINAKKKSFFQLLQNLWNKKLQNPKKKH